MVLTMLLLSGKVPLLFGNRGNGQVVIKEVRVLDNVLAKLFSLKDLGPKVARRTDDWVNDFKPRVWFTAGALVCAGHAQFFGIGLGSRKVSPYGIRVRPGDVSYDSVGELNLPGQPPHPTGECATRPHWDVADPGGSGTR